MSGLAFLALVRVLLWVCEICRKSWIRMLVRLSTTSSQVLLGLSPGMPLEFQLGWVSRFLWPCFWRLSVPRLRCSGTLGFPLLGGRTALWLTGLLLLGLAHISSGQVLSCETRTGILPSASMHDNITVVTSKGIRIFNIDKIEKLKVYKEIAICPAADDLNDVIIMQNNFHCNGGRGSGTCRLNFGAWTGAESRIHTPETIFYQETANDGDGRCAAIWSTVHCASITPAHSMKEMSIAKLIEERCMIGPKMVMSERTSRPGKGTGDKWEFDQKSSIQFKSECNTEAIYYVAVSGGKVYDDMEAKAQAYVTTCPMFKIKEKDKWKLRRSKFHPKRTSFTDWRLDVEWAGGPEGRSVNAISSKDDGIRTWKVIRKVKPSTLAYTIELCGDEVFRDVYVGERTLACRIIKLEFAGFGHSTQNGNPTTLLRVVCSYSEKANFQAPCKADVFINNEASVSAHFSCPVGTIEILSGTANAVRVSTRTSEKTLVLPSRGVEQGYGKDLHVTNRADHETVWKYMIGDQFGKMSKMVNKILPIALVVVMVTMFPGFFRTPTGGIALVACVAYLMMGRTEALPLGFQTFDYSDELAILTTVLVAGSNMFYVTIGMTIVLAVRLSGRVHWMSHLVLLVASSQRDWRGIPLVAFWWFVLLRSEAARAAINDYLMELEDDLLDATTRVQGNLSILYEYDDKLGGYLQRLISLVSSPLEKKAGDVSLRWIVYDALGVHRIVKHLDGMEHDPLTEVYHPRRSGLKRNVRNMRGSIFYAQEFDFMVDLLKAMSEEQIQAMYNEATTVVGRGFGDFRWLEKKPERWKFLTERVRMLRGY